MGLDMRHIAQFVNDPENLLPRVFRDVFFLVDDAGYRLHGDAGFFGDILQGGRQTYSLPFGTGNPILGVCTALSDNAVIKITESSDKVNKKSGRRETDFLT